MVARAPWGTVIGLCLEQVGSGAGVAEGGNITAEAGGLAGRFKVLHECEVVAAELDDGGAATGDDDEDVGRVGVTVTSRALGTLNADGQRAAGGGAFRAWEQPSKGGWGWCGCGHCSWIRFCADSDWGRSRDRFRCWLGDGFSGWFYRSLGCGFGWCFGDWFFHDGLGFARWLGWGWGLFHLGRDFFRGPFFGCWFVCHIVICDDFREANKGLQNLSSVVFLVRLGLADRSPSDGIGDTVHFRLSIIEMRAKSQISLPSTVVSQGRADILGR